MNVEIIVKGRVQGVSFRKYVKEKADLYGIKGIVKNLPDGSVLIRINNSNNSNRFIQSIKKGNQFSKIEDISIRKWNSNKIFKEFEIIKHNNILIDQANSMKNLIKSIISPLKSKANPIQHLAIIPDGNRRWAKAHALEVVKGHEISTKVERIISFMKTCLKNNIKFLTIWAFSTENWNRSAKEVNFLMNLLLSKFKEGKELLMQYNIRFLWLGDKNKLSDQILKSIAVLEEMTKDNTALTIQLALNYGGKNEIISAVNRALALKPKHISEEEFEKIINPYNIPDPDIIIRTGGEKRLSGFMMYSCAYSELFFVDTLFPDFTTTELEEIIKKYYERNRRFGH